MEKLYQGEFSPKGLSPLPLAFVGDGVYELLVREHLLAQGNCPVKKLNSRKVELVRCQFQAQALERLWPRLTGEEQEVALRGRNAHVGHVPKNANVADYHGATALEALFGYLYLGGEGVPPAGAVCPGDGRTLRKAVAHEGEESPYLAAGRAVYAGGFGGVRCRGKRLYSAQ